MSITENELNEARRQIFADMTSKVAYRSMSTTHRRMLARHTLTAILSLVGLMKATMKSDPVLSEEQAEQYREVPINCLKAFGVHSDLATRLVDKL